MSRYENAKIVDELMTTLGVSIADLEVLCHVERFTDDEEWEAATSLPEIFDAALDGCNFDVNGYAWEIQRDSIQDALEEGSHIRRIELTPED